MFPGNTRELPVGAQSREDRGLSFHVYYRQDVTVVFWQENDLCCLLISDAAPTDVIRLAQASVKA